MTATIILTVFIVMLSLEFAGGTALLLLNLAHLRRKAGTVPPAFAGLIDADLSRRAAEYSLARGRLSLVSDAWATLMLLAFAVTGFFGRLDAWLGGPGGNLYWHGLLYVGVMAAIFSVGGLPFALYAQFVIEKRFGFNAMTARIFILDRIKSLFLGVLIGAPLVLGLFFFMEKTGAWWWVLALGFFTIFQLVVTLLYPAVIAPLFNKFTPLPDGALKDKIMALLASLGYRVKGIFVMDGSKRSRHSNAYFTGIGKTKRIVLYDTLLEILDDDELAAVFAHELGHEKLGHVVKNIIASVAGSALAFFMLSLLAPWTPLYAAFGFAGPGHHSLLVLVSLCAGPFTFFLKPLFTALSRRHEYQADRFAKRALGGDPAALVRALVKLHRDNLSALEPHPAYSFFHYSHPTLAERAAALEKT